MVYTTLEHLKFTSPGISFASLPVDSYESGNKKYVLPITWTYSGYHYESLDFELEVYRYPTPSQLLGVIQIMPCCCNTGCTYWEAQSASAGSKTWTFYESDMVSAIEALPAISGNSTNQLEKYNFVIVARERTAITGCPADECLSARSTTFTIEDLCFSWSPAGCD